MTIQVTQCPKCQTSFRVTGAQLKIANGAVRCGSCLHIFHAPDHWIGADQIEDDVAPTAAATPISTLAASPSVPPSSDDDTVFDDGDTPAKPRSFMALDETPEPAYNEAIERFDDTIQQHALDDIFDEDIFSDEMEKLIDDETEAAAANGDEDQAAEPTVNGDGVGFTAALDLDADLNEELAEEIANTTNADDNSEDNDNQDSNQADGLPSEEEDFLISDEMLFADDGEEDDPRDNQRRFKDTRQQPAIRSADDYSDEDDGPGAQNTGEYSDTFLDIDNWEPEAKRVFKDLDELGDDAAADEEDWARKLLDDDDQPSSPTNRSRPAPEPEPESLIDELDEMDAEELLIEMEDATADERVDESSKRDDTDDDPFSDILGDTDSGDDYRLDPELLDLLNERGERPAQGQREEESEEFVFATGPVVAGERIGGDNHSLIANIEPEPVVFATGIDRDRWARRGWLAAIALAVIALAVQYVAFNFDRLARDNHYRGTFATVCPLLGCTLPDRNDIRLIRSTNLMVRSHPKVANALVVDAIITNRADFSQQFPDLELQFTNLGGEIVAGRRFTPKEYLSGELAGLSTMPVQQPVHIALEIYDPGQDAVNYQLYFRANKNR